jgi:hypothetical protein
MFRSTAITLALCLATVTANAALISRAGGQAYWDDVLNITWLADANYAKTSAYDVDGLMTWAASLEWIASLNAANHLGVNVWRLPTVTDTGEMAAVWLFGSALGLMGWLRRKRLTLVEGSIRIQSILGIVGLSLVSLSTHAEILSAVDQGWYDDTGFHNPSNPNYLAGTDYTFALHEYRNFFVFDLSAFNGHVATATLRLTNPHALSFDSSETFALFDVSTSVAALTGGTGGLAAFADLGSGTSYGSVDVDYPNGSSQTNPVDVSLNAAGLAYLNANLGGIVAFGGALTTLVRDELALWQNMFGDTTNPDCCTPQLILSPSPIPIPPAVWLFGSALGVMGVMRRRAIR